LGFTFPCLTKMETRLSWENFPTYMNTSEVMKLGKSAVWNSYTVLLQWRHSQWAGTLPVLLTNASLQFEEKYGFDFKLKLNVTLTSVKNNLQFKNRFLKISPGISISPFSWTE
jgi:hypothetical protein